MNLLSESSFCKLMVITLAVPLLLHCQLCRPGTWWGKRRQAGMTHLFVPSREPRSPSCPSSRSSDLVRIAPGDRVYSGWLQSCSFPAALSLGRSGAGAAAAPLPGGRCNAAPRWEPRTSDPLLCADTQEPSAVSPAEEAQALKKGRKGSPGYAASFSKPWKRCRSLRDGDS